MRSGGEAQGRCLVLVSCAGSCDIARFTLDPAGDLTFLGRTAIPTPRTPSPHSVPMALSPDEQILFASIRLPPFPVASFAVDAVAGDLRLLETGNLTDGMAFIAIDDVGRHLLCASHSGSSLTLHPITDGHAVGPLAQTIPQARAHSVLVEGRRVYVAALGEDRVRVLRLDGAGTLAAEPDKDGIVPRGAGPRHLARHPGLPVLYCLNETDGTLVWFAISPDGALRAAGATNVLPEGVPASANQRSADIHVTPDGRVLYASERTQNTIAAFRIDPASGALAPVGSYPAEPEPRAMRIDPHGRFLLATGHKTGALVVYAIDRDTGMLAQITSRQAGQTPSWIEIIMHQPP